MLRELNEFHAINIEIPETCDIVIFFACILGDDGYYYLKSHSN